MFSNATFHMEIMNNLISACFCLKLSDIMGEIGVLLSVAPQFPPIANTFERKPLFAQLVADQHSEQLTHDPSVLTRSC